MAGQRRSRVPKARLMPINKACHILGVSQATLRMWTDKGNVRAFVTPGGHRRYAEADLLDLIKGQQQADRLKELIAKIEGTTSRHREIAQEYLKSIQWYSRLDERTQALMRESGRHLLSLIVEYIANPLSRDKVLAECRKLGEEFGSELAHLSLSLSEALEAFVLHRVPVLDAVTSLMSSGAPLDKRTLAVIPQINHVIDQTLLALVAGHQQGSKKVLSYSDDRK